jgi:hypothetical protein
MFLGVYHFDGDTTALAEFSGGPAFRDTIRSIGLPSPRVEHVGEVYAARVRGGQVVA